MNKLSFFRKSSVNKDKVELFTFDSKKKIMIFIK